MDVPLRALTWSIRFFWIITFAVAVTCVYSATLIRVNMGDPSMAYVEGVFNVTVPITFDNNGYYSIADLNITAAITDHENWPISKNTVFLARIPPQNNVTISHNISFNVQEIMTRAEYAFYDSEFVLYGSFSLNYASLVPFEFETNRTLPWGAPLFNFTSGVPEYQAYNGTHIRTNVPLSFQNHSPYFSLTGVIRVEILNNRQQLLGSGTTFMDVPSNANYEGEVEAVVSPAMVTSNGQIRIFIESEMFNYGPVVRNYG